MEKVSSHPGSFCCSNAFVLDVEAEGFALFKKENNIICGFDGFVYLLIPSLLFFPEQAFLHSGLCLIV